MMAARLLVDILEDLRLARLPDLIRRLMDERDLTWDELAEKAGMARSSVHVIGTGRLVHPPKAVHLEALAEALGVPATFLKDAAARDYGLATPTPTTDASDDDMQMLIATAEQLPTERVRELQALARAMLGIPSGPSPRRRNRGRPQKQD